MAPRGPFHLRGAIDRVRVEEVLARFTGTGGLLRGQLSAAVDLAGTGTEPQGLQQTLTGTLAGSIDKAAFVPLRLGDQLAQLLTARLPFAKGAEPASVPRDAADGGGLGFDHLAGGVRFDAGTMTSESPLEANTPLGPIELGGEVLAGGTLDLRGRLLLGATQASLLVGNLVTLTEPLAVELAITGPVGRPAVAVANSGAMVKVYLVAYAKGAGARLLGDSAAEVKGILEGAAAKGAAQVDQRTQAARRQAEAATQAATARARDVAASQTQRTAEKAKQAIERSALKGLFGR